MGIAVIHNISTKTVDIFVDMLLLRVKKFVFISQMQIVQKITIKFFN